MGLEMSFESLKSTMLFGDDCVFVPSDENNSEEWGEDVSIFCRSIMYGAGKQKYKERVHELE